TFSFVSDIAVAAIALRGVTNERGDFLMTTLPVVETAAAVTATTVAHFARGGGWITELVLVNPSDNLISGTAQFLGQGGELFQSTPYVLAPRSSRKLVL